MREGKTGHWSKKVRPTDRASVFGESKSSEEGVASLPGAPLRCYQNKYLLNLRHPPLAILSLGQVD